MIFFIFYSNIKFAKINLNTKYYNDEKELVSCDKILVFDNMNKVQEFLTDLSENKQMRNKGYYE